MSIDPSHVPFWMRAQESKLEIAPDEPIKTSTGALLDPPRELSVVWKLKSKVPENVALLQRLDNDGTAAKIVETNVCAHLPVRRSS
ncbi:hypothetical protein NX059_011304 [Plenodomus lindquistii]|nr:hypothetical protein NX059_011304 [Plenodomus lindquistii]